ncbi:alpha/beta hydrolase [Chitinispirillales bacterium ANBcel5]|uniref:alpha/beta hydrolase n=1 Tax=Cellulosispirillum alkaliphilum TaxID=3039283 RepID=UPI002A55B586|nr:alpha/beta hydrolase [Chitinispirillales bacterium ANBcel5]
MQPHKLKTVVVLTLLLLAFFITVNGQTRFRDVVFPDVTRQDDIVYSIVENNNGNLDTLKFDFYSPEGDTVPERPLLIAIHGGGFMTGSRKDELIEAFSINMALRGYAVASISYRLATLGTGQLFPDFEQAINDAVIDSREAVRFFRANAQEYGIDTSKIVSGGHSAGAITALNHSLLPELPDDASESEHPYAISAVLSFSGAIGDTLLLQTASIPVFSAHETGDTVVPYGVGHPFSIPLLPPMYGSAVIHEALDELNIDNKLLTYEGRGHGLEGHWEEIVNEASLFLYNLFNGSTSIASTRNVRNLSSNSVKDQRSMQINLRNNLGSGNYYDLRGRRVNRTNTPNRIHGAGAYLRVEPSHK